MSEDARNLDVDVDGALGKGCFSRNRTRPSLRVHWVACGTCSIPGNFFKLGVIKTI